MLILITGATGSIGKKLTDKMQNSGYQLRVLTRKNNIEKSTNIEYVNGELNEEKSLNKAVKNVNAVIHLAGVTHTNNFELYYQINTEGTKNLIKACQNNNIKRFIYISSRAACREGGAYAESKYLAEEFLKKTDLNWTILRPSEVYGAGGKEVISKLINIIQKSPVVPIVGNGQYLLSPIFIDDLIQSILKTLEDDASLKKTYTISGPKEFTYREMVNKISGILKVKRIKIFVPLGIFKFLAFLFYLLKMNILVRDQIPRLLCKKSADISLAKKDLNFNPRTIEEGIKIVISTH